MIIIIKYELFMYSIKRISLKYFNIRKCLFSLYISNQDVEYSAPIVERYVFLIK